LLIENCGLTIIRKLMIGRGSFAAIVRLAALLPAAAVAVAGCGARNRDPYVLHSERAADGKRVALARLGPCGDSWCESLWIGASPEQATQIATLASGIEHCTEIAWRPDGTRVAFLIDGFQLRIYDAERLAPAGLVDLVPNDGRPPTRVARGVTFSENGIAITFDDCPRNQSGCRPGLIAIR
jgi:hypothetical protein